MDSKNPSLTAQKLSARYGITPEAMQEIIEDSRPGGAISKAGAESSLPPAGATEVRQVTENNVTGNRDASGKVSEKNPVDKSAVDKSVTDRSVVEKSVVEKSMERETEHQSGGMTATAVFLGILAILGIVALIHFWNFGGHHDRQIIAIHHDTVIVHDAAPAPKKDTVAPVPPPPVPTPPVRDTVPPPPHPKAHHKRAKPAKHKHAAAASSGGYSTSSNLLAQERLADLRAAGNRSAYIETTQGKGGPKYKVHSSGPKKKKHR
ncbi:MAG: hypothetical protein ABI444_12680 [Candidatus Kapaibacterium sp.]|jgi:hypothetical protein